MDLCVFSSAAHGFDSISQPASQENGNTAFKWFPYQYMENVNSSMRYEPSEVLLSVIPLHAEIAVID